MQALNRELARQSGILADLRDVELFPAEVLRCGEDPLVALDRKLDACEKKRRALGTMAASFAPELADGLGILREMVTGRPVQDMVAVLDKDDLRRAAKMLAVKRRVDGLWTDIGSIMNSCVQMLRIPLPAGAADSLRLPVSDTAEQSGRYYDVLDIVKDSLVGRAGDEQVRRMYQIEIHGVRENPKVSARVPAFAKLRALSLRYPGRPYTNEINFLFAKALFSQKEYKGALAALRQVTDTMRFGATPLLVGLQSLYALGRYDSLWRWGTTYRFETLAGSYRNCALWMVMESGLALGARGPYAALASLVVKDSSYSLHVMHALARSYVHARDYDMALSVLEGASRFSADAAIDRKARRSIRLTTAQILYEKGDYAKALSLFFELVNSVDEGTFAQSLYGISWCYIRLGMYRKADEALRKLVNQAPQSPYAVQALLTMGQRYLNRAQYEWEKLSYLAGAENRFALMRRDLEQKMADTMTQAARDRAERALSRIDGLAAKLTSESHESDAGVARLYDEAAGLSDLVQKYYATGSFQELSFTEKREQVLHRIDSLLLALKGADAGAVSAPAWFSATGQTVEDIKTLVCERQGVIGRCSARPPPLGTRAYRLAEEPCVPDARGACDREIRGRRFRGRPAACIGHCRDQRAHGLACQGRRQALREIVRPAYAAVRGARDVADRHGRRDLPPVPRRGAPLSARKRNVFGRLRRIRDRACALRQPEDPLSRRERRPPCR